MKRWSVYLATGVAAGLLLRCRTAEAPPAPVAAPAPALAPSQAGCVRGEPEPLLAAVAGKPAPVFVRTAALEAKETYSPGDAPAVVIRHFGCAHYGLEFSFALTGNSDREPGWQRAADLLAALPVVEEMKPMVDGMAKLLRRQSGAMTPERLEQSEMESVTVKVEKAPEATHLTVTYDFVL